MDVLRSKLTPNNADQVWINIIASNITASSNTVFCYKIEHYLLGLISVVYGKVFYKIGNVCGTAIDKNMEVVNY